MFTDFIDDGTLNVVIKNLSNDFLNSDYNMNIKSDFDLEFKVSLYLQQNKMSKTLSKKIATELLNSQQSKINYTFED